MQLIDTHAHIYLEDFKDSIDQVLEEAMAHSVSRIYLPNIDSSTVQSMIELAAANPQCHPMMGLHPGSVDENFESELKKIEDHLFSEPSKYAAVGEIGIDLYWDKTFKEQQIEVFETQLRWAKELALPVVIHVRDSFEEVFSSIDKLNDDRLRGIFHCFTGTLDQARHIMDYGGFMMGIGGILTFKNSGLDKVVKDIPLDYLVLETDSPYLAPSPHRGKQNRPEYVELVAKRLAEIKEVEIEVVAEQTSTNAFTIFGE